MIYSKKFASLFALIVGLKYAQAIKDHRETPLYKHSQCWAPEQPPCTPPTQVTHFSSDTTTKFQKHDALNFS
jgi:hypothetical protein